MMRVNKHDTITEFVKHSRVPVINGLSDFSHPCQVMASIMAIENKIGPIEDQILTWFGDPNNVLNSYIHAAIHFKYELRIAIPSYFTFSDHEIKKARIRGANIKLYSNDEHNPDLKRSGSIEDAAKHANVLITDTWFSMGQTPSVGTESKIKTSVTFYSVPLMTTFNASFCIIARRAFSVC